MKKYTKKIILICVMLLLIAAAGFATFKLRESGQIAEDTPIEIIEEVKEEELPQFVKDLLLRYQNNKEINPDYVGEIHFESGLISLPFVFSGDNYKYYRTDWETMNYDGEGSIFMDEDCSLDSQNIILYGHYVYKSLEPSGTHKFTPLSNLIEEENYKDNSKIYLFLGDEYREYEIASVFYCNLVEIDGYQYPNEKLYYYLSEYEEEYFAQYKDEVKSRMFYETGVDFNWSDKLLTLQTCVENRDDLREIVIAREVDRVKLPE